MNDRLQGAMDALNNVLALQAHSLSVGLIPLESSERLSQRRASSDDGVDFEDTVPTDQSGPVIGVDGVDRAMDRWAEAVKGGADPLTGVDIDRVHERYGSVIKGPWPPKSDLSDQLRQALTLSGHVAELGLTLKALPGGGVLIESKGR